MWLLHICTRCVSGSQQGLPCPCRHTIRAQLLSFVLATVDTPTRSRPLPVATTYFFKYAGTFYSHTHVQSCLLAKRYLTWLDDRHLSECLSSACLTPSCGATPAPCCIEDLNGLHISSCVHQNSVSQAGRLKRSPSWHQEKYKRLL